MTGRLSGICTFAAALVVSACTPPDAAPPVETVETESPTPIHNFGRRGEAGDFDAICRYDVLELPPVMALADFTIVASDLSEGRLVRPFQLGIKMAREFAYFLVYPESMADDPRIVAFRAWIIEEAAKTQI